jgi:hypothetical protein
MHHATFLQQVEKLIAAEEALDAELLAGLKRWGRLLSEPV